ncbi:esterase, putative [Oceanicaulis alexandrii HTCC2633]|uniref:alpha/beta hydrolase n=1 Tax=Oceanicaulis sp. HTCC2633 TaxID=314254 RepID=UPI0000668B35|nr:alpha/beta hydrolase [Oceanicaulis sp. HTCC2633]EAP90395.1 esterase, putative [Oceanicaulis alexandrii HTCC2633] [Oceanicaulis sp. HTCC2633]
MIETVGKQSALSLRRLLARHMARTAGKTVMSPENPRQIARKRMDAGADRLPTPDDVRVEKTEISGLSALTFTPDEHRPGLLLFLHGGGYCLGSAKSHKPLVTRLAKGLRIKAVSVDYRLAPEHVFPCAVDDGAAALNWAMAHSDGPVLIAGDSAGGGLALASLLRQREQGRSLPQGVYLISPWTDLTASGDSARTRANADPMLKPDWLAAGAQLYLEDTPASTPEASPLFADLTGLPPMFIQTGDDEILRDDSIRFAEKLEQAGVPVHCEIWKALWHDFPLFAPLLPEADLALERLKTWAEPILSAD